MEAWGDNLMDWCLAMGLGLFVWGIVIFWLIRHDN